MSPGLLLAGALCVQLGCVLACFDCRVSVAKKAATLRNDGMKWKDIGAELGFSNPGLVYYYAKTYAPEVGATPVKRHWDGSIQQEAEILRSSGHTYAQIGEALRFHASTVFVHVRGRGNGSRASK